MPKTPLLPNQQAPALKFPLLDGGEFDIKASSPSKFDLIIFYRGLHCRFCAFHIAELKELMEEYKKEGVDVYSISVDGVERTTDFKKKADVPGLNYGHSLDLKEAQDWGLYISKSIGTTSIGIVEPDYFNEPALFLVKPDKTIYYINVQSMPFSRPPFKDLLNAIKFSNQKNYPARGSYDGELN